ncbi:sulfotransferase family 2 domain-containing protein [Candidatus Pacearchaeota archaeon]|nr:sulfotransferase family 2 domain-containing protein [Candidatus Pacearchaeota archaeon]
MIFFTHIQKTCGTSITKIIGRQNDIVMWRRRRMTASSPDFVTGHFPYGLHKDWGVGEDYSYATFLRNPVDRWISQFYHALSKNNPLFKNMLLAGTRLKYLKHDYSNINPHNLSKFLRWCIVNGVNKNLMCKQLSGIENMRNVQKWPSTDECSKDFGFAQVYGWSGRYKPYDAEQMKNMVQIARENLIHNYDFVGLHEKADEEQIRFCNTFSLRIPANAPFHAESTPRFREEELFGDKACVSTLLKLNLHDIELYDSYVDYIRGHRR